MEPTNEIIEVSEHTRVIAFIPSDTWNSIIHQSVTSVQTKHVDKFVSTVGKIIQYSWDTVTCGSGFFSTTHFCGV